MKALLRVVLTLLLVVVGLEVGIKLAPRLARFGAGRATSATRDPQLATRNSAQPDWGGGRIRRDVRGERREARGGGVVLQQKANGDYALTLALPSRDQPGQAGLFEVPSSGDFRKQLFPEGMGTRYDIMSPSCSSEAPAADIPLYPQSSCRTQVGRGTVCFIGFYLTPDSLEAVRSFYVRALSRLGWQRIDGSRLAADGSRLLETFTKPGEDRAVVVQLRQQDSVTTRIGLVATGSQGLGVANSGLRVTGSGKERK